MCVFGTLDTMRRAQTAERRYAFSTSTTVFANWETLTQLSGTLLADLENADGDIGPVMVSPPSEFS